MAKTRKQLLQKASFEYLQDGVTGTANSSANNYIADTSGDTPFSAGDDSERWVDAFLYLASGTYAGEERRVDVFTPATKKLTVATGDEFSGIAGNVEYEVRKLISRSELNAALNRALSTRVFYLGLRGITMIPDGDMAMSGVTKWTASNATHDKDTTAGNVLLMPQSLSVTASAANGYVESEAVAVNGNTTYRFYAIVRASATASPKLQVWDKTNDEAVSLVGGITQLQSHPTPGNDWVVFYGSFTTPATCRSYAVRLVEQTNGQTSYWNAVLVWDTSRRIHQAPSDIDSTNKFSRVLQIIGNTPFKWEIRYLSGSELRLNRNSNIGAYIEVINAEHPMLVEERLFYPELDDDSTTTDAPEVWTIAAALVEAFLPRAIGYDGKNKAKIKGLLKYWMHKMSIERDKAVEWMQNFNALAPSGQ